MHSKEGTGSTAVSVPATVRWLAGDPPLSTPPPPPPGAPQLLSGGSTLLLVELESYSFSSYFLYLKNYIRFPTYPHTASCFLFSVSYFLIVSDKIMAAESIDTNCMTLTRYFYKNSFEQKMSLIVIREHKETLLDTSFTSNLCHIFKDLLYSTELLPFY